MLVHSSYSLSSVGDGCNPVLAALSLDAVAALG